MRYFHISSFVSFHEFKSWIWSILSNKKLDIDFFPKISPPSISLFFEKHYHVYVCVQSFRYEVRIPRGGELVVCKGRSTDSWKTTRARRLVFIEGSADRWRFSFSPHSRNKFSVFKRNDHNGALVSLHVKLERTSILSRTVPGIWSALAPTFHEEIILRSRTVVLPRVSNEPLQASTLDHHSSRRIP